MPPGSFFLGSSSPSEFLRSFFSRPTPFDVEALPTSGPVPLRDLTNGRPNCEKTTSRGSVLRLSQPLDGFLRPLARELIPSHCHVQGCFLFRGFSLRAARSSRRRTFCPPAVVQANAHRPKPTATLACLDFEALLRTKMRCYRLGLTARQLAPLVRFSSPPGLLFSRRRLQLPEPHPLVTLSAEVFAHALTSPDRLERLANKRIGWSVSRLPTCSRLSSLPLSRS